MGFFRNGGFSDGPINVSRQCAVAKPGHAGGISVKNCLTSFIVGVVWFTAHHAIAETRAISLDHAPWLVAADPMNVGWHDQWWKEPRHEAIPTRVPGEIQEKYPGYHGVAWYWTEIEAPVNPYPGGRYLLRFEAVNYKSDLWFGDSYLGGHEGGETAFEIDVTGVIHPGAKNRLALRVLDPRWEMPIDGMTKPQSPRRGGPVFQHGGIEGSVELLVAPAARITDLYAQPDPHTGRLSLCLTLRNATDQPLEGSIRVSVSRMGSSVVLDSKVLQPHLKPGDIQIESALHVDSPLLWGLDTPNLYQVTAELTAGEADGARDRRAVSIGFREFRFEGGAFRLNGTRVLLRSVQHSQFDALRFWIPYDLGAEPDYFQRRLIAAKEMGFNCVRIFGGVPPPNLVELADRIGLLLYVESGAAWELRDSLQARQRFQDSVRRMILRDRNHPSIVMWGLLNETQSIDPLMQVAVESLPLVRQLDPTRVVMLNSGRFDYDLRIGSISNPGSNDWQRLLGAESADAIEVPSVSFDRNEDPQARRRVQNGRRKMNQFLVGDLHHYADFPLTAKELGFFRELGAATNPVFLSEFGRGSAIDVVSLYEFYKKHDATELETAVFVKKGLDLFMQHWNDYGLDQVFKHPKDFFSSSMVRSARDRKELINAVRSNPKIAGFSNVALSERIMIGQGLLTLDGRVKPGMKEAMRDALAPVRFCLFTEPISVYAGSTSRLEVVLANADVLPPGEYPIVIKVRDGTSKVVFEKQTTLKVPTRHGASETPLALPVFNEEVLIGGPGGNYELTAAFADGREVPGGKKVLYVFDRQKMPPVESEVTLWGNDPELRTWLTTNGIKYKEFGATPGSKRELILVSAKPPAPGGRQVFEELVRRIAAGSTAVFLSEKVFADGDFTTRWMPLKTKGFVTRSRSWLYGRDEWIKDHPVFEGLQNGGLMDLQFYRDLLDGSQPVFTKIEKPEMALAGCFQTSSFDRKLGVFHNGLLIAEYPLGAGRILLNTLLIAQNLGKSPQAERLLRNMLNYMSRDLAKPVAALPAGFEQQIAALYESYALANPEISIVAPADDSSVKAPGTVAITTWTSEPEVRIERVEFYSDGRKIGEDSVRKSEMFLPFEFIWADAPAGTHQLTVKAINENGSTTTSEPVTVRVVP
jgi:hypothetical protein